MQPLTLPPFPYNVKKQNGTLHIFDILRKKYIVLTPEEWVRQHLIHYLIDYKGYPAALIAVEREIQLYGLRRRFDLVVFDREGQPWLLVECKAPDVNLSRRVFDQAFRYNITLGAPYLCVTNGIQHHCGTVRPDCGFVFLDDFPAFPR